MRTSTGRARSQRPPGPFPVVTCIVGAGLLIWGYSPAATSATSTGSTGAGAAPPAGSTSGSPALKPIIQAALQATVEKTARELLVPGAVVVLRTPQGEFTGTYGATMLGTTRLPRANTHFRIASNTKTMTAAVIMQLA